MLLQVRLKSLRQICVNNIIKGTMMIFFLLQVYGSLCFPFLQRGESLFSLCHSFHLVMCLAVVLLSLLGWKEL